MFRRFVLCVAILVVAGCGVPTTAPTVVATVQTDSLSTSQISKPGSSINAIPPSFPGWSVVSGSQTILFGPPWDLDWKIVFYLPNRSTMPRYVNIAAKNMNNTWLNYTSYMMLYNQVQSGSSYRVTYVFGGGKSLLSGINMLDATNWAMYYHD